MRKTDRKSPALRPGIRSRQRCGPAHLGRGVGENTLQAQCLCDETGDPQGRAAPLVLQFAHAHRGDASLPGQFALAPAAGFAFALNERGEARHKVTGNVISNTGRHLCTPTRAEYQSTILYPSRYSRWGRILVRTCARARFGIKIGLFGAPPRQRRNVDRFRFRGFGLFVSLHTLVSCGAIQ